MDKHTRYRNKNVAEGRCPHCGKSCAPYYECEDRRFYKRSYRILQELVKKGILKRRISATNTVWYKGSNKSIKLEGRAKGYFISLDDRRYLPRIGKKYIDMKAIIEDTIKNQKGVFTEDEIHEQVLLQIKKLKAANTRKEG